MTYKHRDIVIAYMDGEVIQWKYPDGEWEDMAKFEPKFGMAGHFPERNEYRIKPKPVLIRHGYFKTNLMVSVFTKNFNAEEDDFTKKHEDNSNIVWLDDWHEAKFNRET